MKIKTKPASLFSGWGSKVKKAKSKTDKISRLIIKGLNSERLMKIGNRTYQNLFKYPCKDGLHCPEEPLEADIDDLLRHSEKRLAYVSAPSDIIFTHPRYPGRIWDKTGLGGIRGGLTNASTVIQTALDLLTNGETLMMKKGIYDIKTPLVPPPLIHWIGEGEALWGVAEEKGVLLRNANSLARLIDLTNAYGVEIRNMRFKSDNVTEDIALFLKDTANCYFSDLQADYFYYAYKQEMTSVEKNNSMNHWDRVYASASRLYAFDLIAPINATSFFKCVGKRWFLRVSNGGPVSLENCVMEGVYASGEDCLILQECRGFNIKSCYFAQGGGSVSDQSLLEIVDCQDGEIAGNHFGGGKYAIRFGYYGGDVVKNIDYELNYYTGQATSRYYFGGKWKYMKNSGTAPFNGTGSQTVFTIAHGCASTPSHVSLEAKTADASGVKYWSADGTNITVTFITAPPAGTNNVVIGWKAEV